MPLRDRRALAAQHAGPVGRLLRAGRLLAEQEATDEVVAALRLVVPRADDERAVAEVVERYVEADRLVEDRVDGVALHRRLLALHGALVVAERHLDERVCGETGAGLGDNRAKYHRAIKGRNTTGR